MANHRGDSDSLRKCNLEVVLAVGACLTGGVARCVCAVGGRALWARAMGGRYGRALWAGAMGGRCVH